MIDGMRIGWWAVPAFLTVLWIWRGTERVPIRTEREASENAAEFFLTLIALLLAWILYLGISLYAGRVL